MNDAMSNRGIPGGPADRAGGDADYRIREAEARLDRRLAVLEARAGRMRIMTLASGVGFALTLVALFAVLRSVAPRDGTWMLDTVSAREVVLRDGDGIARGRMATDDGGRAQLTLSDRDGRERIRLTVLADGSPGVTIHDPDAQPRAVLGYLPDGTTNLVLADAEGVGRAVLGLDADGSAQALFTDRGGSVRTLVGVGPDGAPAVSVYEGTGGGTRP